MNSKRPTMLMILDGYGMGTDEKASAMTIASKPELDRIFMEYPMTTLGASALDVGLPRGQMGNSEVGHLNIGAGRIVYQDLTRITKSIETGDFDDNKAFREAIKHALKNHSALHLQGLLSDGGVHSHIDHLKALLNLAAKNNMARVYVHCFLDGRDVPPRCAMKYIEELEAHMTQIDCGQIATVSGRYWSMDRDKRWDRVRKSYDAITTGEGLHATSARGALQMAYARGENDEFVTPTVICHDTDSDKDMPVATLNDGDAVIMYNFRPDRAREITRAIISGSQFDGFKRKKTVNNLKYICMTEYDAGIKDVLLAFPPEELKNTLGEYIASLGLHQLRIAETEKYAHVTFFFNGGVEAPCRNEDRILIPSPKVATYDLQPEMSAYTVCENVIEAIKSNKYDLIILNFANADMVGHTGVMKATVKAIETLDKCVAQIKDTVLSVGGQILLTADHGNADQMLEEDGSIRTAHSLNRVPLIHIAQEPCKLKDNGRLADIAPTLLKLMDIPAPPEMTGKSLIKE